MPMETLAIQNQSFLYIGPPQHGIVISENARPYLAIKVSTVIGENAGPYVQI